MPDDDSKIDIRHFLFSGFFCGGSRPRLRSLVTLASPCKRPRMIIEMRTYKIKAGHGGEFLETLESKALPEHQKIGMKIIGPFLSVEDDDTFFWMRGFPDLQSRERMRDEFYEGKLWKAELEQKLMPNLEKFDVVIVDAPNGLGDWR